jgi:hypothetical protein
VDKCLLLLNPHMQALRQLCCVLGYSGLQVAPARAKGHDQRMNCQHTARGMTCSIILAKFHP